MEKSIHSPVDMWKIALYKTADTKAFCTKCSAAELPKKESQNCNSPWQMQGAAQPEIPAKSDDKIIIIQEL